MQSKPSIFRRAYDALFKRATYLPGVSTLRTNYVRLYGEGYHHGSDALEISAVYACVSKIADTIASLEASVVRVGEGGGRQVIDQHPVHRMISREPNQYIGAYEFWQMIVSDALIHGHGFAYIDRSEGKMYHIPSAIMTYVVHPETGEKWYSYDGAPGPIRASDMFEISAFRGLNPTKIQLQNLSTAKSVQDFGSKFFENGGMLGGILSTKEYMDPEQIKQATDMWEREYMGRHNAHKIAILGGGFQYQPLSIPLEQMQYLQVKKYSTEEIARIYQVPPAMIGMENNTAYNNYEQQVLQFQQGTILPWVRRIEMEVERKLLSDDPRLQCVFNVDTLLRGDSKSRSEYYHTLLQDGVLSINEVRSKEGLGPVDGGDNHHIQVNMIPLDRMQDYADSVTSNNNGRSNSAGTTEEAESEDIQSDDQ